VEFRGTVTLISLSFFISCVVPKISIPIPRRSLEIPRVGGGQIPIFLKGKYEVRLWGISRGNGVGIQPLPPPKKEKLSSRDFFWNKKKFTTLHTHHNIS